MKVPELAAINANYKDETIDFNTAISLVEGVKEAELKKLKVKLGYDDKDVAIHQANRRLANKFLKEEYPKRLSVKDITKEQVKHEINACLRILGDHSLLTTDQTTLQHVINSSKLYSRETIRRYVCKINNLLQLAGRTFKLSKPKGKKIRRIPHLTESELPLFIAELSLPLDKLAAKIIFYTGLRTGELFALEDDDIDWHLKQIDITKQLTRQFNIDEPKCGKERTVIYPSHLADDLEKWVDLTDELKKDKRNGMSKSFLNASRRLWGKSKSKDISPHDLRRSFAIDLISNKGFSITELASLLGDTEKVTQDYYAGYAASDSMLDKLSSKMG